MKKNKLVVLLLLLAVIIMCSATPVKGQDKKTTTSTTTGPGCFDGSTSLLNIGIGVGGPSYYNYGKSAYYKYRRTPAFSFMYEKALANKVGPGYLGLGVYFGFQNASLRYDYDNYYYNNSYNNYYYRHSWNYFVLAARGAYHLDALNWEKGEIYFGAIVGLRFQTYSFDTNNPDPDWRRNNELRQSSIYPAWSFFGGGRYYFTDKVGAFMELGYGISYLTLGLTFKF